MSAWTRDTPAPGVVVFQPARGFRYGAEAFWLVGFALEGGLPADALDLGTGSGIMALLLAARGARAVGIDARPEWAEGWARSLAECAAAAALRVADARSGELPRVDLVVTNPPYFPLGSGPAAPDPWKAAARSEGHGTLAELLRAGAAALRPGGRLCAVVPIEREAEVRAATALSTRRVARVGRRRALVELGDPVDPEIAALDEGDPRAHRWYALATGALPAPCP